MLVLDVRGLRAGYGSFDVLSGIDLKVPAGRVVALLGSNGAGKTTLLNTIAGLLPTRSGQILLEGAPVEHQPAHIRSRRGICLIPEGRGIFRRLTVRENLLLQARGAPAKDAFDKALSFFPVLGERLRQTAGTLSGGQQQMLALAQALATPARLIMADELSVGLAPVIVDEIFEVLETLRAEERSMLLVEQYVDRALAIADYVYILHKGNIAFVGEPARCASEDVFHHYLGAVG